MRTAGKEAHSCTPGEISILIVEDEASARDASERYLDYCGYRVASAANSAQAMDRAAEATPDVAVCDWRLGDQDGVEVARQLQSKYGARIVFVTAYPLDQLRASSSDLEGARYLRKPLSLTSLADTIAAIVA